MLTWIDSHMLFIYTGQRTKVSFIDIYSNKHNTRLPIDSALRSLSVCTVESTSAPAACLQPIRSNTVMIEVLREFKQLYILKLYMFFYLVHSQ